MNYKGNLRMFIIIDSREKWSGASGRRDWEAQALQEHAV